MLNLDEYNANRETQIKDAQQNAHRAGVGCPKCGTEMEYCDSMVLMSNPPKRRVKCSYCLHLDYKLA